MQTATKRRTLSGTESKLILELEWRGQRKVTHDDLRSMLGASDDYARVIAHRLAHKGWLERLRPGVYQLIPADRGREGVPDQNPLAAGAVLVDPYFYSYGTACTHHGFTEQVFAEVYVACRVRRAAVTMRGKRYVLIALPPEKFFGFEETAVLGQRVQMATRERAVLDALDRPQYAGGISEVSRIVRKAGSAISWPKLIDLAQRWNESAIAQRLGFLIDLHRVPIPKTARKSIHALTRTSSKLLLGSRGTFGTSGALDPTWGVIQNVPADVLIGTEPQRRKVSFAPRKRSHDR